MTELAVVGGGPAGLAAATLAAQLGVETVLFDEQPAPGGQIYRGIDQSADFAILGDDYRHGIALAEAFRASKATHAANSIVWQAAADGRLGVLDPHGARMVQARRIILATGGMERPVCIPGWTLPGVMGVGAAQTLLKTSDLVPDVPTVIAGSGPLLYLLACQLARAGTRIAGLCITTPGSRIASALAELPRALFAGRDLLKGLGWIREARAHGIPMSTGATDLVIEGTQRAEALSFTVDGERRRIAADLVLLHEGVIPNVQLSLAARLDHVWDDAQACWHPAVDEWGASSAEMIAIAGDGAGIAGAAVAEARGKLAALDAACRLGRIDRQQRDAQAKAARSDLARHTRIRPLLDRVFAPMPHMLVPRDDATIVCRCENVTAGALREAVPFGGDEPNRAKIFTRCGMGPCQGRMCGPTVAAIIAHERGVPVQEVGTYRIRIPVRPLPLAILAELEGGEPDE
jgi:NADPH-dependent 2,4-dienoyl-CoA reductase/sulfur reductase-like enzyme